MNAIVYPGRLSGEVILPPSKSEYHRLLIASALSVTKPNIRVGRSDCPDNDDILAIKNALSAMMNARDNEVAIIQCGESGTILRFLLPVAAALIGLPGNRKTFRFLGGGRLPERPMTDLINALKCGGEVRFTSEKLPFEVSGGLNPGVFTLPGSVSSQYVSGLLFALPLLAGDSVIRLNSPLQSRPYVDMTLDTLQRFGIIVRENGNEFHIPGNQRYSCPESELTVGGDWSAAAFFLAANALGSAVKLRGLEADSLQGDKRLAALLSGFPGEFPPVIDLTDIPDLAPALAVCAAGLPHKRQTKFIGIARLRLKESDRAAAVAAMIRALGGNVTESEDELFVDGGVYTDSNILCGENIRIEGVNDHRIVMAAAIAATAKPGGQVQITDAQAVNKTYPAFWRDFTALGGRVELYE
jgi:3-phosphoshikimate 1-carboxyvinyltransferase